VCEYKEYKHKEDKKTMNELDDDYLSRFAKALEKIRYTYRCGEIKKEEVEGCIRRTRRGETGDDGTAFRAIYDESMNDEDAMNERDAGSMQFYERHTECIEFYDDEGSLRESVHRTDADAIDKVTSTIDDMKVDIYSCEYCPFFAYDSQGMCSMCNYPADNQVHNPCEDTIDEECPLRMMNKNKK